MGPTIQNQIKQKKKIFFVLRFLVPLFIVPILFVDTDFWIKLFSFAFAVVITEVILIVLPRFLFKELERQEQVGTMTATTLAKPDKTVNWFGAAIVICFVLSFVFAFIGQKLLSSIAWQLVPFVLGIWALTGKTFSKKFGTKFRKWEIVLGSILLLSSVTTFIGNL